MNNLGVQHPSQPTTCINTNSHVSQQLFLPPMNINRHPMNINSLGMHQSSLPTMNMNNLSQLRFPFVIYPVNNLCNMVQVPNNITFSSTNNAQNMQNAENHMTEADTKTTTLFNHSTDIDIAPVTMSFNQNSAVTVSNSNVINTSNTTVNNLKILNSGVPQGALNHCINVQTPGLLKQVLNVPNAVAPLFLVPNSAANLAVTKRCFKIKLTPIRPAPQKNSTRDNHRSAQGTKSQKKTLPENTSKTVLPADVEVTEQSFPVIFQPVEEQDSLPELEKVQVKMEENLVENEIQSSPSIGEDQRIGNSLEALQKCCKKIPEYDNYGRKITNPEASAQHEHDKEERNSKHKEIRNRPKTIIVMIGQNKKGAAVHPGSVRFSQKTSVKRVNKSYDSVDCAKNHEKKSSDDLHLKQSYNTVKAQKCNFCGKSYVLSSFLRLSRSKNKRLACDKCLKTINLKSLLKKCKKKREPERFPCDVCGQILKRKWKLEDHMRLHSGERPFPCETCGRRFYSQLARSRHMDIHNSSRKRLCEICGIFIKWGSSLRLHQIRHRIHDDLSTKERSDIANIPYVCEFCGKGFCKKSPYEKHKINKHERRNKVKKTLDGRMICDTCGKSFSCSSTYRR